MEGGTPASDFKAQGTRHKAQVGADTIRPKEYEFLFSIAKQEFTVFSFQFTVFSDALHSNALGRRFAPASEH